MENGNSGLDAVKEKPEFRQFYKSLIEYIQSDAFAPTTRIGLPALKSLFTKGTKANKIDVLNNISYD